MWRVAIYAREAPGRANRVSLDRQVQRLAAEIARQPEWCHVATYADQSLGRCRTRPGLRQLLVDASFHFDLVAVEGSGRISPNRRDFDDVVNHLRTAGTGFMVLRPAGGQRLARKVANFVLADLIGEALH